MGNACKPITLHPLKVKEVVSALLKVKPEPKPEKKPPKKKIVRKMDE